MYYGNSTIGFEADEPAPTAILICPACHGDIAYYGDIDTDAEALTLGDCEQAVCRCGAFYGEDDVLEVRPEPDEIEQKAIEYLTHELHRMRSRAVRYENTLLEILVGARQQSQSHADVTAKCLAVLKKEQGNV